MVCITVTIWINQKGKTTRREMCISVLVRVRVCMEVACICVYVCVHIYMCVWFTCDIAVCVSVYFAWTRLFPHMINSMCSAGDCAGACACVCLCMRVLVHACACACVCLCMRVLVHACACACVCLRMRVIVCLQIPDEWTRTSPQW